MNAKLIFIIIVIISSFIVVSIDQPASGTFKAVYTTIYENLSKKVPVYSNKIIAHKPVYSKKNNTWSDTWNETIKTLDDYDTEYYDGKKVGIETHDKIKYISPWQNVNKEELYLYRCKYDIGDRNWAEYPMRLYEISKGVCEKIELLKEPVKIDDIVVISR